MSAHFGFPVTSTFSHLQLFIITATAVIITVILCQSYVKGPGLIGGFVHKIAIIYYIFACLD